jgi:hypothetical protein
MLGSNPNPHSKHPRDYIFQAVGELCDPCVNSGVQTRFACERLFKHGSRAKYCDKTELKRFKRSRRRLLKLLSPTAPTHVIAAGATFPSPASTAYDHTWVHLGSFGFIEARNNQQTTLTFASCFGKGRRRNNILLRSCKSIRQTTKPRGVQRGWHRDTQLHTKQIDANLRTKPQMFKNIGNTFLFSKLKQGCLSRVHQPTQLESGY